MVWAKQAEKFQVYNAILQHTFIKNPPYSLNLFARKIVQKASKRLSAG